MGFARQVADRVIFMDDGQIVEINEPKAFFAHPQHERTRLFLATSVALKTLCIECRKRNKQLRASCCIFVNEHCRAKNYRVVIHRKAHMSKL